MGKGNPKLKLHYGEHPSSKAVDKLTVEGDYIRSYSSIKEAAESLGISSQSISNAIRKNSVAGHYRWKYSTH